MTRKIARYCDIVMEFGWLLALVTIPLYFNIYTSRVFEPDKITILRSLVLVMMAAWLTKGVSLWAADRTSVVQSRPVTNRRPIREKEQANLFVPDGELVPPDNRPLLDRIFRRRLMFPTMFLCFLYLISTILSIVPAVSWWGSYQRLQGTYTFFSYVMLFLVIVFNVKERRQLERIISFVLLVNVPITLYGWLQHNNADPLPWQGDTTYRVTSTMGNAIFIAAYLILCVPLAVYRGISTGVWLWQNRAIAKRNMTARNRDTALSWVLLYSFFTIFELGLFFVLLQFNASYHPDQGTAQAAPTPGSTGLVNQQATSQLQGGSMVGPWWSLPLGIIICFGLYYLFTVRRQGTETNYLFRLFEFGGYIAIFVLQIMIILFSESRGPEAGLIVGLFLIPPLLFWRKKMWRWLGGWVGIGIVVGGFLLLFNMPAGSTPLEPAFKVLRQNREIARFSQLLDLGGGTGKVRELIWKGDFGIISDAAQHDPIRLLIGYGPESLYQISPLHYQPDLAHYEARNAIPDRSHNGYLDAIITTGFIGLFAYVFFVGVFIFYAIRLMFKTRRFEYQVLLATLVGLMVAHQIEIQVGIQIVSTWMMFWVAAAILVVLGSIIQGSWGKQAAPSEAVPQVVSPVEVKEAVEKEPELEPVAVGAVANSAAALNGYGKSKSKAKVNKVVKEPVAAMSQPSTSNGNGNDRNVGKNAKGRVSTTLNSNVIEPVSKSRERANGSRNPRQPQASSGRGGFGNFGVSSAAVTYPNSMPEMNVRPWFWGILAVIVLVVAWFIYISNVLPIQGDILYKEGSNLIQAQQTDKAIPYFEQAVQVEPNEDFYRLYLGEAYLEKAQAAADNPATSAQMEQDFRLSEQELMKAHEIAPLNADHLANLGRLYSVWAQKDPTAIKDGFKQSVNWFQQAVTRAPYNAYLVAQMSQSYLLDNQPDQAVKVAEHSVQIDPEYDFNRIVLGDAYIAANKKPEAATQYAEAAKLNPKSLYSDNLRYVDRIQTLGISQNVSTTALIADFAPTKDATVDDHAYDNMSQGIVYYYRNNLGQAENLLTQVLSSAQAQPNSQVQGAYSFYAHLYLARVYAATGRQAQAQNEAQSALNIVNASGASGKPLQPLVQEVFNQIHATPAAPTSNPPSSNGKP